MDSHVMPKMTLVAVSVSHDTYRPTDPKKPSREYWTCYIRCADGRIGKLYSDYPVEPGKAVDVTVRAARDGKLALSVLK